MKKTIFIILLLFINIKAFDCIGQENKNFESIIPEIDLLSGIVPLTMKLGYFVTPSIEFNINSKRSISLITNFMETSNSSADPVFISNNRTRAFQIGSEQIFYFDKLEEYPQGIYYSIMFGYQFIQELYYTENLRANVEYEYKINHNLILIGGAFGYQKMIGNKIVLDFNIAVRLRKGITEMEMILLNPSSYNPPINTDIPWLATGVQIKIGYLLGPTANTAS